MQIAQTSHSPPHAKRIQSNQNANNQMKQKTTAICTPELCSTEALASGPSGLTNHKYYKIMQSNYNLAFGTMHESGFRSYVNYVKLEL